MSRRYCTRLAAAGHTTAGQTLISDGGLAFGHHLGPDPLVVGDAATDVVAAPTTPLGAHSTTEVELQTPLLVRRPSRSAATSRQPLRALPILPQPPPGPALYAWARTLWPGLLAALSTTLAEPATAPLVVAATTRDDLCTLPSKAVRKNQRHRIKRIYSPYQNKISYYSH